MNPDTLKESLVLAKLSDAENVIMAPPFLFIEEVGKNLKKAKLAAQDLLVPLETARPIGPLGAQARSLMGWIGAISPKQLKKLGVKYVIIGHSERRQKMGETDEIVAKKIELAFENNLIPILCVGETAAQHKFGETKDVIKNQLSKDLPLITSRQSLVAKKLIVAYEPVWAIGTGNPETPEEAKETIKFIKQTLVASRYPLVAKVLYGGSVNSQNIKNYLQYKEIDGVLVGGASLDKKEIRKLISAMPIY